ncbi:MAG TPA: Uma2 family endonuclease [Blastocatellia bacterium]|nr:Uma2 family endonuclease [Blastocatellia bacterium]
MSAVATSYLELVEKLPPNSVLILNNVPWDDYENLLEEREGQRRVRITYDRGKLEIMTLSAEHEGFKSLLAHLVAILAEEMNQVLIGRGSVTLRRELTDSGVEPDDCYYIRHAAEIRGKKRIDLKNDPPPDLVIEVDVASPSLNKLPLYAALGVPEVWRLKGDDLKFYRLVEGEYLELAASDLFPFLPPSVLMDYLRLGDSEDIIVMNRAFREWVRQHRPAGQA